VVLLAACASDYKTLKPAQTDPLCAAKFSPRGLRTAWYTAHVDVYTRHLSGLLLVKQMPDSSSRVVFTNEAGVTFFDFEFDSAGHFTLKQSIEQLNRKAVITSLQKNFALALGIPFKHRELKTWSAPGARYMGVEQKKETAYFITDADCASLQRLELGSKRKQKVTVARWGRDDKAPDSLKIQYHTFNMVILLKKLER
jgi:hypothetical protein